MLIFGFLFLTSYPLELPDELKSFFSKYGKVVEHQIIRDHETNRSRGFGFVIFESEEVVDEMLSKGNMVDIAGTQVRLFSGVQRNQHICRILVDMEHALLLHSLILLPPFIKKKKKNW